PSPTATHTPTRFPSATPSATVTPSATFTATQTPTATFTATPSPTNTPTATWTASPTATLTSTRTPSPSPTDYPLPQVDPLRLTETYAGYPLCISGRGLARDEIVLLNNGEILAREAVEADGTWTICVYQGLPSGAHRLEVFAEGPGGLSATVPVGFLISRQPSATPTETTTPTPTASSSPHAPPHREHLLTRQALPRTWPCSPSRPRLQRPPHGGQPCSGASGQPDPHRQPQSKQQPIANAH
ncbi:MAG: hypothetical protein HC915_10320, partial [Anaerolineae bacterium]|nr:hypothetical protein [Anaerolineae bacterium]